ncbi:aldehyde dehydrogenase family protein [Nonomuraea sediminis]|uniref:aldehyde dehydrogenase family protein n=1 Tax=Nonomuraea sediminis TaxID=2835864 RepID=UPI001BDC9E22|nr:aldehyde dehydrogenase family protein [Nonomuraea sediminis]
MRVRNPLTGETERDLRPPADLPSVARELRAGQPAWAAADRTEGLTAFARALAQDSGVVEALVADTGRRIESELEHRLVVAMIERWAAQSPGLLTMPPERASAAVPYVTLGGGWRPYELVGVISPWNFPLLLCLIDAIPALAAGCAVLVKPSEVTPRFIEPLMRLVPEGVPLRVIEGDGETGAELVGLVDAVAFTGSVPTGRAVAEAAARAFIPAFLELGGKDPAIVLPGADLDRATSAILWGGTANAGQSCLSIERVYVARELHDDFVTMLAAKAATTGLVCEGGPIGPLIDPAQATVIERHLDDAVAKGATVHTGGAIERHGGGRWCRPTVVSGVDHGMLVMTEETFGPILPIMPFDTVEEAITLANDTDYGLSASVFGPTEQAARSVAEHLDAGAISVNDAALTAVIQEGEKNSFKLSGMGGSRMGPAALRRFLRRTSYLVNRSADPNPWWY